MLESLRRAFSFLYSCVAKLLCPKEKLMSHRWWANLCWNDKIRLKNPDHLGYLSWHFQTDAHNYATQSYFIQCVSYCVNSDTAGSSGCGTGPRSVQCKQLFYSFFFVRMIFFIKSHLHTYLEAALCKNLQVRQMLQHLCVYISSIQTLDKLQS